MIGFLPIPIATGSNDQSLKEVLVVGDREMGRQGLPVSGVFSFSITPKGRYQFWSFTNQTLFNDVDCVIEDFEMGTDGAKDGMEYRIFNGSDYKVTLSASAGIELLAGSLVIAKNSTAIVKLVQISGKSTYNPKTFSVSYQSAVATITKRFVLFVGNQDSTGFLDTEVRENTTGVDTFTFTRVAQGVFDCPEFSPKRHCIRLNVFKASPSQIAYTSEEGGMIFTMINLGVTSDYVFDFGGFIIIEEIDEPIQQ